MPGIKTERIINWSLLLFLFFLFAYVVARTVCVDMTQDEAYSFHNVKKFWYAEVLCTGNSHWINLCAIKAAILFGGEKAGQVRWFTVISAFGFLYVGYLWLREIKELYLKFFAFAFAFLNPYLIDYFSMARGYASGLLFEVISILLFILSVNKNSRRYAFASLLCAGLSAIANFNFFYFFCAFCFIYFFKTYFFSGKKFLREMKFYIDAIYVCGIVAVVLRALLFIRECSNDIAPYGGETITGAIFCGFIDTLNYGNFSLTSRTIYILAYILLASTIISVLNGIFRLKKHSDPLYFYSSWLLLLMLALTIFNKLCFDVLYPTYRTTLMFYPLMAIIICSFLRNVSDKLNIKKIFLSIATCALAFNFMLSINFKSTFDYFAQADSKECLTFLQKIKAKHVGIDPLIYCVYVNYYQMTDEYKFSFSAESINTYIPKGIDTQKNKLAEFDYLVLVPPYKMSFYGNNNVKFEGVKLFPLTKTLIVKVSEKK